MINSDFVKKRVVIYARVSTEHEAQISALENQMDWYKPILAARPEWTLVGQYVDEGITGTSAAKRPQFMKMIADAKKKQFDMISPVRCHALRGIRLTPCNTPDS